MADPTNPILPDPNTTAQAVQATEAQSGALQDLDQKYIKVTGSALDFNNIQQNTLNLFQGLGHQVQNFSGYLGNLSAMNDTSTASFGLMSAALIKASDSFRHFTNIDTTRVVTFSEQYKKLLTTIRESPIGSTAAKIAIDTLKESMAAFGLDTSKTSKVIADLKNGVIASAESFLTSADNILHLSNTMIQNAAAQGNMQDLLKQTGVGFEKINGVVGENVEIMNASMTATGLTKDHMESFMNILKDLPGGMKNFGDSIHIAGQDTSILTAAIQYATGSGREMASVQKDMMEAMTSYGASTNDALKYTARMSEVSETLHARIEDVQAAVGSSVQAFKSFVYGGVDVNQMTKGMTDAMEQYVSRLQSVHVPTKNAIEMVKNLQDSMSKLSMGQEAFMSAQTGGPGGLRGALQIEDLMKTDPAAAQRKMEETIRKQMGPIISREQAKQSEGAAAKYTMQMQMLQQGPMGAMVKDRGQAAAMMEAMATGKTLQSGDIKGTLNETVQRGQAIEQLSMTKISEMNVKTDSVSLSGGVVNLTTMQNAMPTARSGGIGEMGTGRGLNEIGQTQLRETQAKGIAGRMDNPIKELLSAAADMLPSFGDAAKSFVEHIKSGDKEKIQQDQKEMQERIAAARAAGDQKQISAAQRVSGALTSAASNTTDKQTNIGHDYVPASKQTGNVIPGLSGADGIFGGFGVGQHSTNTDKQTNIGHGYAPAGKQVGNVIPGLSGANGTDHVGNIGRTSKPTTLQGLGTQGPIPVTLAPGSSLTVQFTGKCPHCNTEIRTTENARATSVGSQASGY